MKIDGITVSVYDDIKEILASIGMNLIVAVGFWLDYKNFLKNWINYLKKQTVK